MTLRHWPRNSMRTLIAGAVALIVVVPTFTLIPVAAAQVSESVVAVDVDLIEDGVWVTWSNGCIDSRAWRQPLEHNEGAFVAGTGLGCGQKGFLFPANYPFHHSRPIRAPLTLADGERVVALVPTEGEEGYWLVTSAGRVVTGGAAAHLGDLSAFTLNAPVVAAAPTTSGNGYYMLTEDGGVFSFGDAVFYGSVQGLVDEHVGFGAFAADHITAPVVTLATTPAGYWLVAADGAVFPFGDAAYHGSIQDSINTGNQLSGVTRDWVLTPEVAPGASLARDALSAPVIGVVPSDGGTGYQMVAADGGIFNFGVSQFHGSLADRAPSPAVASDVTDSRSGYVILTEEGRVHRFGVMDGEWDKVGRIPTALTPTALPAQECRPPGQQGFPLPWFAALPTGPYDVGVLLVEFDDHRALREVWTMDAITEELTTVKQYLEASSYGELDVEFTLSDGWISLGSLNEDFYTESAGGSLGLSSGTLIELVLERAADRFDFSNQGIGYDQIMLVLPPSWFHGGRALRARWHDANGITVDGVAVVNSSGPFSQQLTWHHSWWKTAAHELMHLPGLSDLYAYRPGVKQRPEGWTPRGWSASEFGLMGWQREWPLERLPVVGERSPRIHDGLITLTDGRSFVGTYELGTVQEALEMLAWHRWRMGWLRANQVVCLSIGDATVDLAPLAKPGADLAAAIVQLASSEFLVIEHRKRIGYDADRAQPNWEFWYDRPLSSEGVLAYVVDVSIYGGSWPVEMFGWAETSLKPGEDWILSPGEWRTQELPDGTTLRLDVSAGPDDTMRVNISTTS